MRTTIKHNGMPCYYGSRSVLPQDLRPVTLARALLLMNGFISILDRQFCLYSKIIILSDQVTNDK